MPMSVSIDALFFLGVSVIAGILRKYSGIIDQLKLSREWQPTVTGNLHPVVAQEIELYPGEKYYQRDQGHNEVYCPVAELDSRLTHTHH